jgi:hypothetical protein
MDEDTAHLMSTELVYGAPDLTRALVDNAGEHKTQSYFLRGLFAVCQDL